MKPNYLGLISHSKLIEYVILDKLFNFFMSLLNFFIYKMLIK